MAKCSKCGQDLPTREELLRRMGEATAALTIAEQSQSIVGDWRAQGAKIGPWFWEKLGRNKRG